MIPQPLTVTTITYVPNLIGYYEQALDILKFTFAAFLKNTDRPFDFMVFDNGSCPEVVEFLLELKRNNLIQWLCLSSKNMMKLGAWNHLFTASRGELVYYFDSDMFHYPGWIQESAKIMETFPKAGMVCAYPVPYPERNTASSIKYAEEDPDIIAERGYFVSEDLIKDFATNIGKNPTKFLEKILQRNKSG